MYVHSCIAMQACFKGEQDYKKTQKLNFSKSTQGFFGCM
jgi:hypothetical protein